MPRLDPSSGYGNHPVHDSRGRLVSVKRVPLKIEVLQGETWVELAPVRDLPRDSKPARAPKAKRAPAKPVKNAKRSRRA